MCTLHYGRMRRYGSTDQQLRPIADRFWEKVNKDGPTPKHAPEMGSCWEWIAAKNASGYGAFGSVDRRHAMPAHRWAFMQENGPIEAGLHLDHVCRNPPCVRPSHLEAVTPKENMRRGWMAQLEAPPHCPTCTCKAGHS